LPPALPPLYASIVGANIDRFFVEAVQSGMAVRVGEKRKKPTSSLKNAKLESMAKFLI
jgi:hypothetical protein